MITLERIKKLPLPILILCITAFIIFMLVITQPSPKAVVPTEATWPVSTQRIQKGAHQPELVLYGRIQSGQEASLTAAIDAYVQETYVSAGDIVTTNELLIQLDPRDIAHVVTQRQADVIDAKAQIAAQQNQYNTDQTGLTREQNLLQLAENALKREQKLFAKNLTSKAQVDQAKRAVEQQALAVGAKKLQVENHHNILKQLEAKLTRAEALLKQAELDLSRTKITAPFNGRITKRTVAKGDRVQRGSNLIALYDINHIEVNAQVPTNQLAAVREIIGSDDKHNAVMQIDGQRYQLRLKRLAGEVQQGQGGVDAIFEVVNGNSQLEIGRSVKLNVRLKPIDEVFLIPSDALYSSDTIYRVQDERLEQVKIHKLGEFYEQDKSYILIQNPTLADGDHIVVTQLPNAIDGLKVTVVNQSQPDS